MFEQEMIHQNPRVWVENVWGNYEERFPEWFKANVRFATMCFAYIADVFVLFYDTDNIFDLLWL